MKRISNIISAALLIALAVSCGRKLEYEYTSYVGFDSVVYSVDEDVELLYMPVSVSNPAGGEVQVKVSTEDGKAMEGVNYSVVSPVSGVLTLAAGETEGVIVIEIVNIDKAEPDGTLDFTVKLESVEGSAAPVGGCNQAKVRINDLNHPLKAFIGTWNGEIQQYQSSKIPMSITIVPFENDETFNKLMVYDIDPFFAKVGYSSDQGHNIVQATGSPDKKSIVIENEQTVVDDPDNGYVMMLNALEIKNGNLYKGSNVKLQLDEEAGTLTILNDYGAINSVDGYIYSIYEKGAVLKKK